MKQPIKKTTKTNKRYQEYSTTTQRFLTAVENHLVDKFGGIEEQQYGILDVLAYNFELFNQCKDQLKKDGLVIPNRFGINEVNPLIKTIHNCTAKINTLCNEFGLTPRAIKTLNTKDTTIQDNEDYIKNLLG